jgi:heme/copper-type cytochrome/quinol oxidase subunit 2
MWMIVVTLLVVVIAIAAVWTFTARRASRTPRREPHEQDHVGRT